MVCLAYLPALFAGFVWDDTGYLTSNDTLLSWGGLRRIWLDPKANSQYYPLVFTSWWIEYHLWGLHPLGYHLINVLLHAANAALLWSLLRKLEISAAWPAAALFALHPLHVESVAWATERKDVLSGFFALLTLLAWRRWTERGQAKDYTLSVLAFLLALLSKAAVCPLAILLCLGLWRRKPPPLIRRLRATIPFLALALGMGLLHVWVERKNVARGPDILKPAFGERILIPARALWFYLGKLLWPSTLTAVYPRWDIKATHGESVFYFFSLLAAWGIAWLIAYRGRKSLLVVMNIFVIMLAPALGLIWGGIYRLTFVADHFQYLAGISVTTLLAALWERAAKRFPLAPLPFRKCSMSALLFLLGALTWRQSAIYRDPETFWRANLAVNPQSWMSHNQLGLALIRKGSADPAREEFEESLRLNPDAPEPHFNLGELYGVTGRREEALAEFRQAVRLRPDEAPIHHKIALLLAAEGKSDEAIREAEEALTLKPDFADAHYSLGALWDRKGNPERAIQHYSEACRISPDLAQAHVNLGVLLAKRGDSDAAIEHFLAALKLRPDSQSARINLEKARAEKISAAKSHPSN